MCAEFTEKSQKLRHLSSIKSPAEKAIAVAGKFPNCKGLYPDCPEKPDKQHKMCRTCPILYED